MDLPRAPPPFVVVQGFGADAFRQLVDAIDKAEARGDDARGLHRHRVARIGSDVYFEGLAPTERLRFSSALGNAFRIFDTLYNYYREGIIDAATWATLERPMEDLVAYPGIQAWWHTRKEWFSPAYRQRMGQKLDRGSKPRLYGEYLPEH